MSTDALREALAAGTPRPWKAHGGSYGSIASTNTEAVKLDIEQRGADHVAAYGGALVGESIQPSDRDLIVAAVNGCEALLDRIESLEAALRVYANPQHWALERFDLAHPKCVYIGPGAEGAIPNAPGPARVALAESDA